MGKRELVALLNLSSWCLVMAERLFLVVPVGCMWFVIVVFPDHTHLLFYMLKSKNAKITKTQYVAPIEYFRLKANKLMVSDAYTGQSYCRIRNLISHRTFGISLQVISDLIKAITVVRQLFLRHAIIPSIKFAMNKSLQF